jgi:hypothetical protein
MDKLKMQTANKADENFRKLAAMFPNAVTETINENGEVVRAIDKDVLMQEIACTVVDGNEERYQFTWPDKKKSVLLANAPINKTLRPCREESVDFDTTENLYIEGDNLEVLKLLQETYLGKIKMIYIDPPYNTGSDSFVYDDDFSMSMEEFAKASGVEDEDGNIVHNIQTNNEANGRFHTDWLNMMYPRLKICKTMLKDDGVLFISIDNNEISNMKKLCDEVFGESSFVTIIHAQMSTVQGQKVRAAKAGNIVKNGEHILVYSRNGSKNIGKRPLLDPVKYDNHYSKMLKRQSDGVFTEINLTDAISQRSDIMQELYALNLIGKNNASALSSTNIQSYYEYSPLFKQFVKENAENIVRVHDSVDVPKSFFEKMQDGVVYLYTTDSRSYLVSKDGETGVSQRIALSDKLSIADDFYGTFGPTTIRGDWWAGFYLDMGNVSKEGNVNYDNGKKPVRLIKQLIDFCTEDGDIILDFFSGSATTAHAAMVVSSDSNSKRNFIMVQLDENLDASLKDATAESKKSIVATIKFLDSIGQPHILSEIGKERIRRAGKQIKEDSPLTTQDLDIGFRVLKCDTSNMKEVYYNPAEYEASLFSRLEDNIKEDRTPEDLLFQVMLDLGVMLSGKIEETTIAGKKVFNVEDNYLIACFDSDVTEETITAIAKQKPYYFVMRDSSMANDSVATNFDQIFATYSPDTVRKVL